MTTSHINILHADPRRLLVAIDTPDCHLFVASLHVPLCYSRDPSTDPMKSVQSWWITTQRICAQKSKGFGQNNIFTDANASVGSFRSRDLGGEGLGTISPHVTPFVRYIDALCFQAPATWRSFQQSATTRFTFRSSENGRHQTIDYVLCSSSVFPVQKSARAWTDFETDCRRPDHYPVVLQLHLSRTQSRPPTVRCVAPYDDTAVGNPAKYRSFHEAL